MKHLFVLSREYVARGFLLLIIFSPIVAGGLQFLFCDSINFVHYFTSLARMVLALSLALLTFFNINDNKISLDDLVFFGCVGFVGYCVGIVLSYLGVVDTDLLRLYGTTEGFYQWNEGLGGGVMGMYRGEVGAFSAAVTAFSLPYLFSKFRLAPIFVGFCLLLLGFFSAAYVGSRQGMAAIGLVFLVQTIYAFFLYKENSARLIYLSIFIAVVFVFFNAIAIFPEVYDWVFNRFISLFDGEQEVSLGLRDYRIPIIYDRVFNNWWQYLFGVGFGFVSDDPYLNDWGVVYVDSDFFWMIQQFGVIGVFAFFLTVFGVLFKVFKGFKGESVFRLSTYSVCGLFLFFSYGHFVFSNWQPSHASAIYFNVMFLGVVFGRLSNARKGNY